MNHVIRKPTWGHLNVETLFVYGKTGLPGEKSK